MGISLKNNYPDRMINLGTIEGKMLCFGPSETAWVDDDTQAKFQTQITNYINSGFLSVVQDDGKIDMDLNNDGVVDKKDKSIAAKVLRHKTNTRKTSKRKHKT